MNEQMNDHLFNTYCVSGIISSTRNTAINKMDKSFCSHGFYILEGRADKYATKHIACRA